MGLDRLVVVTIRYIDLLGDCLLRLSPDLPADETTMQTGSLREPVALVAGASSGIDRASAQAVTQPAVVADVLAVTGEKQKPFVYGAPGAGPFVLTAPK